MMPYEPGRGKTLLIPSGTYTDPNKKHLFVTLTDACPEGSLDLLASSGVSTVALLDDNALSGKTLERCRNLLLSVGVSDVQAFVTRFSGERREGQIRMSGTRGRGIVDPEFLVRSLKGYVGETRFSRSYSMGEYTSPTGVFNLARSRILKYLHENTFSSLYEREGF